MRARRPRLKEALPGVRIGFVGAHTMVLPDETLQVAPAVDFVTTGEFDYAVRDIAAGAAYAEVAGMAYRAADGTLRRTPPQPPIHDLDAFPFVTDVYARSLTIEHYYIGYLQHPTSRCTPAAAAAAVAASACGRRPSPATPTGPARSSTSSPRWRTRSGFSRRCASSSSTTTPSPTTARAPRRSRAASAGSA